MATSTRIDLISELVDGDRMTAIFRAVQRGPATDEHKAFVARLRDVAIH